MHLHHGHRYAKPVVRVGQLPAGCLAQAWKEAVDPEQLCITQVPIAVQHLVPVGYVLNCSAHPSLLLLPAARKGSEVCEGQYLSWAVAFVNWSLSRVCM